MIAVILIGGLGTRLRPFTRDTPKPLLPVVNRPFLEYQFLVLKKHGVKDVVLCTSYLPELFRKAFGDGKRLGMRIRYVHERVPMGTAGAVKNAERMLDGTTLVLNGDILNALDVTAFLKFHRKNSAKVTIALTRVKDPTLYGLVVTGEDGRVRKFLEKPSWDEIDTNTVNAGAYLFERDALRRIPEGVNFSLERSLFPQLLHEREKLYGYVTGGYWIDIGTVEKYLQIHIDIAGGATPFKIRASERDGARVVLGPKSSIAEFARFSGKVCIGTACEIGKGAFVEDCVVMERTRIGEGASLKRCVIGPGCVIGAHVTLSPGTALAGGSVVKPFSHL